MTPEDDALWPVCGVHNEKHWCDWTRQLFIEGGDADTLKDGLRYAVPIVPTHDLYASVSIGNEIIPGICYELGLVMPEDPFGTSDTVVEMGLWTRGEGRMVIATSINNWALAVREPECKARTHGFEQEMKVQEAKNSNDAGSLKATDWCMAYYKCCYPCHLEQSKNTGVAPQSFTASSFGLDSSVATYNPRPANARQNRARDALRARYSNRSTAIASGKEPTDMGDNKWPSGGFI